MKRKRLVFDFDVSFWVFPLVIKYTTCRNSYRPWTLSIHFLCFSLWFLIDEYCYYAYEDPDDKELWLEAEKEVTKSLIEDGFNAESER